jgi:hypothetical protein
MTFSPNLNIRKVLWPVATALFSAAIASAQQPACTLTPDQLPDALELRGFRLGMTYDQVEARVPQIRFGRADQFGVAKVSINPVFDPRFDQTSFAGVRTISLDFLDGKLVILWIGYDSTFKWQTVDEFVAGISKSLNLPAAWSAKRGGRQLMCDKVSVFVSMIAGSPSIRISDEAAQEIVASRREEAAAAAEAGESLVIGDKRTKLYYPAGCAAQQTTPESSRVTFKDKDEAEKAGYKLAKGCS